MQERPRREKGTDALGDLDEAGLDELRDEASDAVWLLQSTLGDQLGPPCDPEAVHALRLEHEEVDAALGEVGEDVLDGELVRPVDERLCAEEHQRLDQEERRAGAGGRTLLERALGRFAKRARDGRRLGGGERALPRVDGDGRFDSSR